MTRFLDLFRPLAPAADTFRRYNVRKLRRDVIAGLTVSVVELPQSMAYAAIANVPVQYGIYTSVIQGVLGALFSSSNHLTTGPTNTQSLLIAAAVARLANPEGDPAAYLQIVFTLTFLKGLIQLFIAALRFGDLSQFISRSVILGIATGAGVLILTGQLASFLGVRRQSDSWWWGVPGDIERIWPHIGLINPLAIAITLGTVAVILGARAISKFIPGSLIAVVLAGACVAIFGWSDDVGVVGPIEAHFPRPSQPIWEWDTFSHLLSGAMALALLGGIEAIAIAKSIAARTGERIDANQEFFAQGLSNSASSFLQCIPGSASFTRSALDHEAGAATRVAAILNAVFVGILFFLFARFVQYIPWAALAGVLLVVAWGLLEFGYFFRIYRADRSDALVFAVTFFSTVLLPLQSAVFIGILLNIIFYLRTSSRLHIAEMIQTDTGGFIERPIYDKAGERKIIFLQLEGELYFAISDQLHDQLAAIRRSGIRIVVMRLKRCHSIDATVLYVLEEFAKEMNRIGGHVILCGLRPEAERVIRAYGLDKIVGQANVFPADTGIFTSAKKALNRARQLVDTSIDASRIKIDEEGELSYEI